MTEPARIEAPPRIEIFPYVAEDIVRLGDLDHQAHVNNAVYATYMETGRVSFMRNVFGGLNFGDKNFVVGRLEINYLRELHWPGRVEIGVGVERIGRSSVTYLQAIYAGGAIVASGRTTMVFIDRSTRRSTPILPDIVARLERMRLREVPAQP